MYFTDRGIEELEDRRGDEEVTLAWVAERLQEFTDLNPEFETAVERLATSTSPTTDTVRLSMPHGPPLNGARSASQRSTARLSTGQRGVGLTVRLVSSASRGRSSAVRMVVATESGATQSAGSYSRPSCACTLACMPVATRPG